jgi:hypothetical protein
MKAYFILKLLTVSATVGLLNTYKYSMENHKNNKREIHLKPKFFKEIVINYQFQKPNYSKPQILKNWKEDCRQWNIMSIIS